MSTEREIVEKLKEALVTRNTDVIAPYVAEDATIDILPSTVGKKLTGANWISQMAEKLTAMQAVEFVVTNLIEHPLFVVIRANFTIAFPSGPLASEMMFLLHYTKGVNGSLKITSIVEYVDSFKVRELGAIMAGGPPAS